MNREVGKSTRQHCPENPATFQEDPSVLQIQSCCVSSKASETHLELGRHIAENEADCGHPHSKGRNITDPDLEQELLHNIMNVLSDKKEEEKKSNKPTLQDAFDPLLLNASVTPMHNHFLAAAKAAPETGTGVGLTSSSFSF